MASTWPGSAFPSSTRGPTLAGICKLIDLSGGRGEFEGQTTLEACKLFKTSLFKNGLRGPFMEALSDLKAGRTFTAEASATIVMSWASKFLDLVDAIEHWESRQPSSQQQAYWWGLFTVQQYDTSDPTFDWSYDGYNAIISKVGRSLFMLPWESLVTRTALSRAWCLLEVATTLSRGGLLEVITTPVDERRLVTQVSRDYGALTAMIGGIGSGNSKTYHGSECRGADGVCADVASGKIAVCPDHTKMIRDCIQSGIGFDEVDRRVGMCLQSWVARVIQAEIKLGGGWEAPSGISALLDVGANLKEQGRLGEAKDALRRTFELASRLRCSNAEAAMARNTTMKQLAEVLYDLGDLQEAEKLFAAEVSDAGEGASEDPETLLALATAQHAQGRLVDAERVYRLAYSACYDRREQSHATMRTLCAQLAVLLQALGREDDAKEWVQLSMAGELRSLRDFDPFAVHGMVQRAASGGTSALVWVRRLSELATETGKPSKQQTAGLRVYEVALISAIGAHAGVVDKLAYAEDERGVRAIDVAPRRVRNALYCWLLLDRRYEALPGAALHTSDTSVVLLALDRRAGSDGEQLVQRPRVALKFMRNRAQWEREVTQRGGDPAVTGVAASSSDGVLPLIEWRNCSQNSTEKAWLDKHGFGSFPFLVVMPAADKSLASIIDSERAGANWAKEARRASEQLARALASLHARGTLHGDVKPRNAVRVGNEYFIIDMDASVPLGAPLSEKRSTAFIPPEVALALVSAAKQQRQIQNSDDSAASGGNAAPVAMPVAAERMDTWAFGVTLYEMLAGKSLLPATKADELDDDAGGAQLRALAEWTLAHKLERLSAVADPTARHLLSLLLYREPELRPRMAQALQHGYFTGKTAVRNMSAPAKHQVFLSYRKVSDLAHVSALASALEAKGVKVWWDLDLPVGENWKHGFCCALADSDVFIALISRGAIGTVGKFADGSQDNSRNWAGLTCGSPCDNVLLEHRLALELQAQGIIRKVVPIMIGDQAESGAYLNWNASKPPRAADVVVDSLERETAQKLSDLGLGAPMRFGARATAAAIWQDVAASQGLMFSATDTSDAVRQIRDLVLKALHRELPSQEPARARDREVINS